MAASDLFTSSPSYSDAAAQLAANFSSAEAGPYPCEYTRGGCRRPVLQSGHYPGRASRLLPAVLARCHAEAIKSRAVTFASCCAGRTRNSYHESSGGRLWQGAPNCLPAQEGNKQGRTNRRNTAKTSADRNTKITLALTVAGWDKVVCNGFITRAV